MAADTVKAVEGIPKPVVRDDRPLLSITYVKEPGNPERAYEILRQRVLELGLRPLEHKSPCLNGRKELFGLFGSLLKGTHLPTSDIDFAVEVPRDFAESPGKYVKGALDRAFYVVRSAYGYIAYGEVDKVDVALYFVRRGIRFHAFEVDGALACLLTDSDRELVKSLKQQGRAWGAVGAYGGVPGVAIEWAVVYARERGVPVEEVLLWHYIPARPLMGVTAGNTVGRTFRVNQAILSRIAEGELPPDPRSEEMKYVAAVADVARRRNLVFEYFVVRENLPTSLVYSAFVKALGELLGPERAKYVGRQVGVFGYVGYNGYVMGVALPAVIWHEHVKSGVSPDRISLVTPGDCWLEVPEGTAVVRLEGGILCRAEALKPVDLRGAVARAYSAYKTTLASIYDKYVTVKIV